MKPAVRIAVTGAAGQIAYSLIFSIANGELFGPRQPVILHLLEATPALGMLKGVLMELDDCVYPLLQQVQAGDDAELAFRDVDYAFLVGAKPRGPGMERQDLLRENAPIFKTQGRALNAQARREVKVLVVGNPANTNAYVAMRSAPDLDPRQFTAMTRLDHNRALGQLALRTGVGVDRIKRVSVWGNHSALQYPDLSQASVNGVAALSLVDPEWVQREFVPTVQNRGAAVINARGKSSAASAANAALMHMRDWVFGTPADDWVSMAVASDGSYDTLPGLMYSFPVRVVDGHYQIVPGLQPDAVCRDCLRANQAELEAERRLVADLLEA